MSVVLHGHETFHRFKDLPAEIQHKIWKIKIDEEIENLTEGRIIKVIQRKLKQTIRQWQEINEDPQSITDPLSRAMELFRDINSDAIKPPFEMAMMAAGHNWHVEQLQRDLDENLIGMYSPQSIPPNIAALLSVSYDLRMLMEKTYSFACGIAKPMVFFNFELDNLFLSYKDFHIASNDLSFVRSLIDGLDSGRRKDWGKVKFLSIELPTRYFQRVGPDTEYDVAFHPFIEVVLLYFTGLKELTVVYSDYSEIDEHDNLIFFEPICLNFAIQALRWGLVENLQDFESYDYAQGMNFRVRHYYELQPLVQGIPEFARRMEENTGAHLKVPGIGSLFIKLIIGPTRQRMLEDAHQDCLGSNS
ncbi:uncharacterized protein EAF01_003631 [Botrytis porri]|uniref:2EXR domain-containing protein n=1 Tax=Botrytis porri TaxID=87229 RepID=A0A4Z1KB27_9HELO|nr:uncharacterized protein EAF01_003631 [Botrytis porri]KAF7909913.1 hypothetical protein EAF01_003631 [Botrytis porri]TGO83267.1 hypothetical protein BPOR_0673g00010 [Botrytis porri]